MSEVYGLESWLFPLRNAIFFVFSENNLKNALENSNSKFSIELFKTIQLNYGAFNVAKILPLLENRQ